MGGHRRRQFRDRNGGWGGNDIIKLGAFSVSGMKEGKRGELIKQFQGMRLGELGEGEMHLLGECGMRGRNKGTRRGKD